MRYRAGGRRAAARTAIAFAMVTGLFIASYTLWDKYAVSTLRTPPLLQGRAAFPVMLVVLAPLVLRDRPRLAAVWRSFRAQAIAAGVLAPLAYGLVLIALSFTAVAAVAPAREVSVLFGVLLGPRLLGEGSMARRLAAAARDRRRGRGTGGRLTSGPRSPPTRALRRSRAAMSISSSAKTTARSPARAPVSPTRVLSNCSSSSGPTLRTRFHTLSWLGSGSPRTADEVSSKARTSRSALRIGCITQRAGK